MAEVVERNGRKYWVDPVGDEIPEQYVRTEDKRRDRLVESIMKIVVPLHEKLKAEKAAIQEKTGGYLSNVANTYNEEWKGNARISNFRGDKTVEVSITELIDFDEKLQVAKRKIDSCMRRWTEDSKKPVQKVVTKVFKTDKQGKLNKQLILSLLGWGIQDPEWEEAMDIIKNSIKVVATRTYYNFYIRDADGSQKAIVLNFSAL